MPDETAAAYFRAREIEELDRAVRASDSTARLAHYELAGRYALNHKAEDQRVTDPALLRIKDAEAPRRR